MKCIWFFFDHAFVVRFLSP